VPNSSLCAFLGGQLVGQGRNRFGHFHCQVFTAGVQRGDGLGFQILDLGVVLAYAVGGQLVLGHDGDQFATGIRQRGVGVADFLVEDAQGLLIERSLRRLHWRRRASAVNNLLQMD
jgi:hypothetical protein